jgi:hypothetical protein
MWILEGAAAAKQKLKAPRPTEEWRALAESVVAEGARNDTLARFAGHLLNGFNDTGVVHTLLQAWNVTHCTPPLSADEVESIVASIAERELRKLETACSNVSASSRLGRSSCRVR